MKKTVLNYIVIIVLLLCFLPVVRAQKTPIPWQHGPLRVSEEGRYLRHEDGTPFFWLGETGWLLPERLDRDKAEYYLESCRKGGFNVVQVQTMNGVPAMNVYGQSSLPFGFHFEQIDRPGVYGYWDHMDYIIDTAARKGIYIGMVCIWGGLVKGGLMDVEEAQRYGEFLAHRYKDRPNVIWMIGGDIRGDVKTEVWEALAESIRSIDTNHLMTFHPFGRTSSAIWFHNAEWLDFHMFQSGHRRYGQGVGEDHEILGENMEEDNWRYVDYSHALLPLKPVIDAEPIYEHIPQGLHDPEEPRWQACDVRRFAYWSVFAGSFGHTYGHNAIMQFLKPGVTPAYGAHEMWYEALHAPGFNQMKYLKALMLTFPFFERIPDQEIIQGKNGQQYERIIATRGNDYMLVYNYTGRPFVADLSRITGKDKDAWWYNPSTGALNYLGTYTDGSVSFQPENSGSDVDKDRVLVVTDASKEYLMRKDYRLVE